MEVVVPKFSEEFKKIVENGEYSLKTFNSDDEMCSSRKNT
jgi:hypothetical protein